MDMDMTGNYLGHWAGKRTSPHNRQAARQRAEPEPMLPQPDIMQPQPQIMQEMQLQLETMDVVFRAAADTNHFWVCLNGEWMCLNCADYWPDAYQQYLAALLTQTQMERELKQTQAQIEIQLPMRIAIVANAQIAADANTDADEAVGWEARQLDAGPFEITDHKLIGEVDALTTAEDEPMDVRTSGTTPEIQIPTTNRRRKRNRGKREMAMRIDETASVSSSSAVNDTLQRVRLSHCTNCNNIQQRVVDVSGSRFLCSLCL